MNDTITTGPPTPSKFSQEMVMDHAKTGRSTGDPRTGRNMAGSRNVVVGIAPEHSHVPAHPPSPEEPEAFLAQLPHVTSRHSNAFIGSHHDEETGLHHLELVGATPSKMAALHMAQHLGENHAYNLA